MITTGKRKQTLQNNSLQCGIQPQGKPFSVTGEVFNSLFKLLQRLERSEGFLDQKGFKFLQYSNSFDSKASKNKRKQKKNKILVVFFAGSSVPFFRQNLSRA